MLRLRFRILTLRTEEEKDTTQRERELQIRQLPDIGNQNGDLRWFHRAGANAPAS